MKVSQDGIVQMPESNKPGDRWALLEKTSPSGKAMFRCMCCGSEDIAPRKTCWEERKEVVNGEVTSRREIRADCMTWQKHRLHTYSLPSENGEGWAFIVVSSTGYFSAVSDFGNYAFFWSHHGHKDFRQFLVHADYSWDYFCSKLSYGPGGHHKVYDGDATCRLIKEHILGERRHGGMTKEEAREEWDLLCDECENVDDAGNWDHWMRTTKLSDAWEYRCERWPGGLERFCKETLKRLSVIIIKELEREGLTDYARRK